MNLSAGTTSNNLSAWVYSNLNGISFGLNGSTITASVNAGGNLNVTAGTTNVAASQLSFADNAFISWGLNGSTISAQDAQAIGRVSHIGVTGENVGSAIRIAFSDNASFSWSATTAAGAFSIQGFPRLPNIPFYMNNGVGSGYVQRNSSSNLWVTPFLQPMPGNITADTLEVLVAAGGYSSTQFTASYGFTMRGGIYTLANSTQLSLVNSFSTTRSATTESFSSRNNMLAGDRYITVASSLWSSSPVFSAGVQYWIGLIQNTAGTVGIANASYANRFFQIGGTGYRGDMGVSHGVNSSFGFLPFLGTVATTGIPATIGTAAIGGDSNSAMVPVFCLRQGIARGA